MNTGLANLYIDNTEIGFTVNDASTFDVPVPQIKSVRTMGWCFYDQNNSAYMHQILIDDVQVSNVVSDMPGIVNVTESNDVITLESAQSSMIKYALAKTPNGAAAKLAAQPITYTEPFEVPGVNKYIAAQAYGHNGDFEGSYKVYGPYSNSNAVDLNKFYHLSPWTVLAAGGVSKTDTLQLGNKSGQIRISASDNVSNPEYIADSRSADNAGNVLSLTADSDIYIDFKDSYEGSRSIDDIKLVFRTVNNLAAYDFDLFYKTAEGEYVFFYGDALDDVNAYTNDRYQYMYPTVVLSGFADKLPKDMTGLKIRFNANDNGNATDVCEIDMNLKDDRLDVQREDAGIELSFAKIYSDNMVIQRDKPIKLWGYGGYEDMDITVEVKNSKGASVRTATVSTDAEQKWYAELPAIEGGLEKYTIEISETDDELGLEPCVITNVVFGDVYIGSGQSNMELSLNNTVTPLKTSANGTVEAERIENELKTNDYSNVRFFRYPKYLTSLETLDDAYTGQWVTAEKFENIAGVSAVSYFFAKDLYNQLDGEIPVAVLTASAGGSSINAWIPNDGSLTPEQISNNTASAINSGFYNAMIYPFTKVNIKGVIWYQGEADANQYEPYKNKYNTLKSEWRGHWGTDLDFTAVQLTSYGAGNNWALMRQGQMQSWLKDENSGLVNTIDVGSETTIHPLYKAPVGNRLALNVAARLYNKDIEYQGPLFESLTKSGDALVISFTHADGLKAQSRTNPYTENFEEDNAITGFEVSADGNNWVSANAVINGNTVTVTGINNPKYVRYAWANAPVCNLYNSSDLPAVPFKANINDVESAPTITVAGNTATISGNAVDGQKLKNDFVVAVAKFKNNILQSVELKEFNTILNENTSFEFTTEDSENDIEVMIFDSMENLTPLTYKAVK